MVKKIWMGKSTTVKKIWMGKTTTVQKIWMGKTIVENYNSSKAVEQKVMFTLYNDEFPKKLSNRCKM